MLSRDLGDSGKFNPLSHWRRCGVLIVYFEHIHTLFYRFYC